MIKKTDLGPQRARQFAAMGLLDEAVAVAKAIDEDTRKVADECFERVMAMAPEEVRASLDSDEHRSAVTFIQRHGLFHGT